jgi:hypothetical protein
MVYAYHHIHDISNRSRQHVILQSSLRTFEPTTSLCAQLAVDLAEGRLLCYEPISTAAEACVSIEVVDSEFNFMTTSL